MQPFSKDKTKFPQAARQKKSKAAERCLLVTKKLHNQMAWMGGLGGALDIWVNRAYRK